jgi:hypothetical protein
MGEVVYRKDRDAARVIDGPVNRVSIAAAKRYRESKHEEGRQSLREKIGVPTPPRTLRAKIMENVEPQEQPARFDVVKALREAREKRERRERVRHS